MRCRHIHSEHGRCVRPRTLWYETGAATTRDKRIGRIMWYTECFRQRLSIHFDAVRMLFVHCTCA